VTTSWSGNEAKQQAVRQRDRINEALGRLKGGDANEDFEAANVALGTIQLDVSMVPDLTAVLDRIGLRYDPEGKAFMIAVVPGSEEFQTVDDWVAARLPKPASAAVAPKALTPTIAPKAKRHTKPQL
jgi:hypothetical protein